MMETKHERGFREQVGIMVGIFRISDHDDADQVFIQVKTSQVIYILTVNNSREAYRRCCVLSRALMYM